MPYELHQTHWALEIKMAFSINEISDTSKGGDTDIQHCLLCSSHRHIPVRSYISPNDKKLDAAGEVKSNAELKILTGPHL